MPRFSIVTCTWNSMKTLADTVQSISQQTFQDLEHVFVDGGSTDGTLDYIRQLPGNIRLIEGVGGGISRAMNVGIDASCGEIVAHLHSDDYYLDPGILALVDRLMRESGSHWMFGRCATDIDGEVLRSEMAQKTYSYKQLLSRNIIPHPATFVSRAMFKQCGGFSESIRYAMDYDMWLRLGRKADPLQVDDFISAFRVHKGSLSSSNRLAAFDEDYLVRRQYTQSMPFQKLLDFGRYHYRRYRLLDAIKTPA